MAKPEWGIKRICLSCGARFYDLNASPILCPSCGTVYDVEVATRVRKSRPSRAAVIDDEAVVPVKKVPAEDEEEAEVADDVAEVPFEDDAEPEVPAETDDEEEDDALIEDVEELDDGDDMSDVIEGGIDEDEEPR
jgi:uncharacterized protein (TIGR02300 family)